MPVRGEQAPGIGEPASVSAAAAGRLHAPCGASAAPSLPAAADGLEPGARTGGLSAVELSKASPMSLCEATSSVAEWRLAHPLSSKACCATCIPVGSP